MEGVTSPSKMKHFLKIALINKIFKDWLLLEASNKRFFLRKATIKNHMAHSGRKLLEEYLQHKTEEWKKGSYSINIFFQPWGKVDSTDLNSVITNDLDSNNDKNDFRMGKEREHVSPVCLLNWKIIFLLVMEMSWFF